MTSRIGRQPGTRAASSALLAVFVLLMMLSIAALALLLAGASVVRTHLDAALVLSLVGAVALILIGLAGCSRSAAGKVSWPLLVAWGVVAALTWTSALAMEDDGYEDMDGSPRQPASVTAPEI